MIVAGEISGDSHSAALVSALNKLRPDLVFFGVGGKKMSLAGVSLLFDIQQLSIIGFTDVLKNFARIRRVFRSLLEELDNQRPAAVILVDYPGFNLKLAKEIKKRNIPVIYYISPQIWAWWKGRIKTIKNYVDKMIVLFKFEEGLYKDFGVDAAFVGHPLLDIARPQSCREDFLNRLGLPAANKTIGIVPGSRQAEVNTILPILLETAALIKAKIPQAQFSVLKSPQLGRENYLAQIKKAGLPVVLCENQTYDFLNSCDFVLAASGTATLETAIMQKPMVIVYKVSWLNWLIARMLIRLPFIGLVNVVAGRKIVPEFIQFQARAPLIAQTVCRIMESPAALTKVKVALQNLRKELGDPGASQRAAVVISHCLG